MKISKEQFEKLVLDISKVAENDLGIKGVIKDSESFSVSKLRACPDFLAVAHLTIEFDIAIPLDKIESSDPCTIVTSDHLI